MVNEYDAFPQTNWEQKSALFRLIFFRSLFAIIRILFVWRLLMGTHKNRNDTALALAWVSEKRWIEHTKDTNDIHHDRLSVVWLQCNLRLSFTFTGFNVCPMVFSVFFSCVLCVTKITAFFHEMRLFYESMHSDANDSKFQLELDVEDIWSHQNWMEQ